MSHNVHTATTQSYDLASSLLNTPFIPAAELKAPRVPRNRAKKYPCTWEDCNRFFDCPHNVQQHIREAHTGERPYKCDECAADGTFSAFSRQYGLNRHKRQVHFVGTKSSDASNPDAAAGHQWSNQSQAPDNYEFAGIGAMLAQANFEMGTVSNDVEMSECQFHFDAELYDTDVSGAQDSGILFACGECGHVSATEEDTFTHMHASHKTPNTRFCYCKICTTMFTSSEEDAANHRMLLRNGAFHAASDASFAQDGPNVTMAPAWSAAQLGTGDATGWDAVDPALLSFSGR